MNPTSDLHPVIFTLRAVREQRGIKQADLAARLDLTQSMLSSYETGTRPVTLDVLARWAFALDMLIIAI